MKKIFAIFFIIFSIFLLYNLIAVVINLSVCETYHAYSATDLFNCKLYLLLAIFYVFISLSIMVYNIITVDKYHRK